MEATTTIRSNQSTTGRDDGENIVYMVSKVYLPNLCANCIRGMLPYIIPSLNVPVEISQLDDENDVYELNGKVSSRRYAPPYQSIISRCNNNDMNIL